MINFFLQYQWELFISAEILSFVSLLLFGITRYFFGKQMMSLLFIFIFLGLTAFEAIIALIIYRETGEISTFTVIISIFILYAFTFGWHDFKRLDRWMKQRIGKLRGIDLLSEEDIKRMMKQKDPRYIRKRDSLMTSLHVMIFITSQIIFWSLGPIPASEWSSALRDISHWVESGNYADSPYPNETLYGISIIWLIIVVIDLIYTSTHLFTPRKA